MSYHFVIFSFLVYIISFQDIYLYASNENTWEDLKYCYDTSAFEPLIP